MRLPVPPLQQVFGSFQLTAISLQPHCSGSCIGSTRKRPRLRIADIPMMIEDDPSRRASSDARQALTVALLKPGRGTLTLMWAMMMMSSPAALIQVFRRGPQWELFFWLS